MNLLLTGATGFVGTAFASHAAACSAHRITGATRRHHPPQVEGVHWLPMPDLSTPSSWRHALHRVDCVVHLAARVHVMQESAGDPLAAFRAANTAGTLHLARAAAAAGVRRFVFVSTVKVHGESSDRPFTETAMPAPHDPYAISKHEAELGLRAVAEQTGMEVVVVRPPLVYGPGVKANFAALTRAVASGWPLPLGAIHNRRSLVALHNLVDFILTCVDHPAAAGQTFLVSDGEDLSTTGLLRRLGAVLGRPARLLPVPPALLQAAASALGRGAEIQRLCGNLQVDIGKARNLLGWTPPIGVDEGLRRAVQGMARP